MWVVIRGPKCAIFGVLFMHRSTKSILGSWLINSKLIHGDRHGVVNAVQLQRCKKLKGASKILLI